MIYSIDKQIQTTIKKEVFYIEGKIKINSNYFIKKIEEGISLPSSLNNQTNVRGCMTSWFYFMEDIEFQNLFTSIIGYIENETSFKDFLISCPEWSLKEAWGLKETYGNYTKKHNHSAALISGVIYLSNAKQELIFEELNTSVIPEEGKFVLFSSDLQHYAKRLLSNCVKYGIAFNIYEVKSKYV